MLAGPAQGVGLARRRRQLHHPVGAQPPQDLGWQVREQERQAGYVVAGVKDDQDGRIPLTPVPGGDQPGDDIADLGSGDRDLVVPGTQADGVQHRGPRGAAGFQRGDDRVRPARDHLRLSLPAPVDVAEQPARAGRRAGPQPAAHIHRQHQPAICRPR